MDLDRFSWIDVLVAHEPAGFVGTNRGQRDIKPTAFPLTLLEALLDVREVLRVRGIAGEKRWQSDAKTA